MDGQVMTHDMMKSQMYAESVKWEQIHMVKQVKYILPYHWQDGVYKPILKVFHPQPFKCDRVNYACTSCHVQVLLHHVWS